ncbi:MAG TPA: sialidase family protein [Chthonomonadaceae bacterium]|nr:sialidase family protein [Chthonomonadaceae bacterium]
MLAAFAVVGGMMGLQSQSEATEGSPAPKFGSGGREVRAASFFRSELIFPPNPQHNHGSCLVECPNGDLLACWYRGSGERTADDVAVLGARLRRGSRAWTEPFVLADTPGFPDTNPCMIVDPQKRLWLFWVTVMDNHWESGLLKYKISRDYQRDPGAPRWNTEKVLHIKPGPEFLETVQRDLDRQWEPYPETEGREKVAAYLAERHKMAQEKLTVRLGWMTRAHPFILDGKRLIVPLYSDGFDFSLMTYSDDWGATWQVSRPLVGPGNVQPSLARRKDGTLVAFFRDNGPPPQRVMQSESHDGGLTWSLAHDIALPDPGAGLEVLVLQSGRWLLINNDTEKGRHSLAISISEDEGRTWPHVRHLERDAPGPGAGSYSYPSLLQARDGTIHATYSYTPSAANAAKEGKGETIKHVQFNEAWLLEERPDR